MKKTLIFILIILVSYSLGILTHKYKLPPYDQIKFVYRVFFPKPNQEFRANKKIYSDYSKRRSDLLDNFDELPNNILVKYSPGMNIWSDRAYINQKNDKKISNYFILKQKRHNYKEIVINSEKNLEILRVKCVLNNNSRYKDWKKLDFKLLIIGSGCIHEEVFSKKFNAGKIVIFPNGPKASDPIFINKSHHDVTILNKWK